MGRSANYASVANLDDYMSFWTMQNNSESEKMRITGAGLVGINKTANANMTQGITIGQNANDNEILAFKSSEIAHGMTDVAETDTYGRFLKQTGETGGLKMEGFTETTVGMELRAYYVTDNTTKSSGGWGSTQLRAFKSNGSGGTTNPGTDANMFSIHDGQSGNAVFIFDFEGTGHAEVTWTTYDAYDDLATITEMEDVLLAHESPDQTPRRHAMEATGIIGKGSWRMEKGKPKAMVNFTKLAMLHHGALIQTGDRFKALEDRLLATEGKLALAESKLQLLED